MAKIHVPEQAIKLYGGNEVIVVSTVAPLSVVAAEGSTGSLSMTLLIGCIGAGATLLGVVAKSFLDRGIEREKHQLELKRLSAQLEHSREDARRGEVRKVGATLLSEAHKVYESIKEARQRRRAGDLDNAAYILALRAVQPGSTQVLTEELSLLSTSQTAKAAQVLWTHLRSGDFVRGVDVSGEAWMAWKAEYWSLRQDLVVSLKTELIS